MKRPFDLILASASPRRRELLERMGLALVVAPVDLDETPLDGEKAGDCVRRLAAAKCDAAVAALPAGAGAHDGGGVGGDAVRVGVVRGRPERPRRRLEVVVERHQRRVGAGVPPDEVVLHVAGAQHLDVSDEVPAAGGDRASERARRFEGVTDPQDGPSERDRGRGGDQLEDHLRSVGRQPQRDPASIHRRRRGRRPRRRAGGQRRGAADREQPGARVARHGRTWIKKCAGRPSYAPTRDSPARSTAARRGSRWTRRLLSAIRPPRLRAGTSLRRYDTRSASR